MSTITLPNIRVSSDLEIRLKLKDGGVAIDWSTLTNIKASIYSDRQRSLAGRCDIAIDEEDSTILVCRYSANKPQYPGVNRVIVCCTYDRETKTYDKPAFTFVRWTDDQAGQSITIDDPDIDVEISVEDVSSSILQEAVEAAFTAAERADEAAAAAEHMVDIHTGPAGKSAYEVAVEEGYTGTEEEWLASLEGPVGATPDISIGTVTTVEPGTPAAATMTGTPGAPVLNLTIPKGVAGDTPAFTVGEVTTGEPGTPVVVTITGTAAAPVLNITIPQGIQGNTGSSVDYPYELVNNLTTNDATKGLSAAQGKVLKDELTQLEHKGDMINPLFVADTIITDFSGYNLFSFNVGSDGKYGTSSSYKHIYIPVKPGQRVRVLAKSDHSTQFAFFWDADSPASGNTCPIVDVGGNVRILVSAGTDSIVSVPDGAMFLVCNMGSTSSPQDPASISIVESEIDPAEEQMSEEKEYECANLEDPNKLKAYWTIDSRDGRILRQSNSQIGITHYIPVNGGGLYCNNKTASGTYGRCAVYDSDKVFIRSFNSNEYTYQSGDAFVRFTVALDSTQKVITRITFSTPRPMAFDGNLVQTTMKDADFIVEKKQVPELHPASGLVGEPGKMVTAASLANGSLTIADAPKKLKPNCSLSFYGKITSFGFVEIGGGRTNNTGWGVRISSTSVSAVKYNGGMAYLLDTKSHGLSIGTFIYVSIIREGLTINVKLTSFGGDYVGNVSLDGIEKYGTPFAYVDENTTLTDVKFGWVAKDLRNAIWFFGASYCSLYTNRMLTQLRDTYGVSNFAIIAEAGNDFDDIWPSLTSALNFGTPKYLVCGIGMNTTYASNYWYYLGKMKNLCRAKGIILVLCTIPWPEGGTKGEINSIVRGSGERYIDLYSAVSSDENGTWYQGYCDDGVHPTLIGAKAMAARIMLDLPEILEY